MTDAINSNNGPRSSVISVDQRGANARADKAAQSANQSSANSAPREDATIVELSSSNTIAKLSEQIKSLPEVNEAKVESIKTSLINGEYSPDAETIARKYNEIEKLLP